MTNRLTTAQSIMANRRWRAPAIVILAATAALAALIAAPPADAAANQARPAPPTEATAPRDAGEPIMAIVSIKSQQVTIYDADGWILRAPVSSGTTGRETPAGVFSVVEKDKDHHSNLYDDASMPNMQRITWSGIALHGGPLPGHAASHGCVRMPYGFAEKLFDKTQRRHAGDHCAGRRGAGRSFPILRCSRRTRRPSRPRRRAPKRSPTKQRRPPRRPARQRAPPSTAARAAAPLAASLRKLEWLKSSRRRRACVYREGAGRRPD